MYPALAVAEALQHQTADVQLTFVGTVGGFERPLVEKSGVTFVSHDEVQAGPIHGVNPIRMLTSGAKLIVGTMQAFGLLRRHKPQVILSTGGWVSLPVALAGRLLGIPMLIFLPDIEPGLTIKTLRLFAKKVALTVSESAQYFREGQTVVTGYPLRRSMLQAAEDTHNRESAQFQQALDHFGLDTSRKTLLVFGGSRGARAINIGVVEILPQLLEAGIQIIHVTGTLDAERTREQVAAHGNLPQSAHYHAYEYLHDDMALSMAVADLVVCRAGASTLAEFPLFGLPPILIPLAYSWRYQQINADYLAKRGAAIHLPEEEMPLRLFDTIHTLLQSDAQLDSMRAQARSLARPDGAMNVAQALRQLTG